MSFWTPETGRLVNEFPYVRLGNGKEKLIVLPGLNDALQPVTSMPRYSAWSFKRFARTYSVFLVSRKRGLPEGYSTRDMAADYAAAIEGIGFPVHVLGLSMGADIAQYLAVDFPGRVHGLILSFEGSHATTESSARVRKTANLARRENWRAVYMRTVETTYSSFRPPLWRRLVPPFTPLPKHPMDFIVSAEAYVDHDVRNRLREIAAPTLVVGGTEDRTAPERTVRELADQIPGAELQLLEGIGCDIYEEDKRVFELAILDFLRRAETM